MRILLVDDDAGLRALLRTTFEAVDVELDEASSAATAAAAIEQHPPDVMVLDVQMPGMDGLAFCRAVKGAAATRAIGVVLLSGNGSTPAAAREAGADAFLRKPFSPLELLAIVERLAGGLQPVPFRSEEGDGVEEQLELYARDLRHLLEIERVQRRLLQNAYRETVLALASALESKDTVTRAHSQRVQRYAMELAREVSPRLVDDPTIEYGFLLHDVGKIGIPDTILNKRGPLSDEERRLMKTHTTIGEQMLGGVAFLQGEGLKIVRHHHERWDGDGYPDKLVGTDIPLGARVFAVADALDAMTSDRPYRPARSWQEAGSEIMQQAKRQFDPFVVKAFRDCEPRLRAVQRRFAMA
jgi:response regulator RpfG family c-di-GMP phosphodiesterase